MFAKSVSLHWNDGDKIGAKGGGEVRVLEGEHGHSHWNNRFLSYLDHCNLVHNVTFSSASQELL